MVICIWFPTLLVVYWSWFPTLPTTPEAVWRIADMIKDQVNGIKREDGKILEDS